jgi:glycerol-3-phosphate dehydrogenase
MLQFLEKEGTKVCNELFNYAKAWKQPISISKSVYQVFHCQIEIRELAVFGNGTKIVYKVETA